MTNDSGGLAHVRVYRLAAPHPASAGASGIAILVFQGNLDDIANKPAVDLKSPDVPMPPPCFPRAAGETAVRLNHNVLQWDVTLPNADDAGQSSFTDMQAHKPMAARRAHFGSPLHIPVPVRKVCGPCRRGRH